LFKGFKNMNIQDITKLYIEFATEEIVNDRPRTWLADFLSVHGIHGVWFYVCDELEKLGWKSYVVPENHTTNSKTYFFPIDPKDEFRMEIWKAKQKNICS